MDIRARGEARDKSEVESGQKMVWFEAYFPILARYERCRGVGMVL